jgi:hypothetical protein
MGWSRGFGRPLDVLFDRLVIGKHVVLCTWKVTLGMFLQEIAIYCPELMADAEEDLLTLLKDSDDSIKEGVVHIMSKSGASFRKGSGSEGRR